MNIHFRRLAVLAALALVFAACGADDNTTVTDDNTTVTDDNAEAGVSSETTEAEGEQAANDDGEIVIGQSSPQLSDAGQQVIQAGLKNWVEGEMGWTMVSKNANADALQQARDMDGFITQGVDAIIVDPVDGAAICPSVEKAEDAGIPVFGVDRRSIGCELRMTVLSDNLVAGADSGQAMVDLLTEKYGEPRGTVLEIQGDMSGVDAQLRGQGFNDVLAEYPDIEIIQKPTKWTAEEFAAAVRDVATTTDIDGIYMHSDCVGTPPVISTLDQIGKLFKRGEEGHIFLTGVDGCQDTLKAFRDGYFDATSSQPLTDFGIVTKWIAMTLNGEEITGEAVEEDGALWSPAEPEESDTGWVTFLKTTPITPENVDDDRLWANNIE